MPKLSIKLLNLCRVYTSRFWQTRNETWRLRKQFFKF